MKQIFDELKSGKRLSYQVFFWGIQLYIFIKNINFPLLLFP